MIDSMQPYMAFMNVENSRCYIDDLYSNDWEKCHTSIQCIKNSVIGSNRQKESVIAQGIVPRLMQLLQDRTVKSEVRLEACVTIGSLAKGTEDHVELLLNYGTVNVLLNILEEDDNKLIDAALCCLRTLTAQDATMFNKSCNTRHFDILLTLAAPLEVLSSSSSFINSNSGNLLLRQSCVATILSTAIKGAAEQNVLHSAGAINVLAWLLRVDNAAVRVPVLACIASLCFENKNISLEFFNASMGDTTIPLLLVNLVSRDKPVEMQLGAAKCMTNIYRSGAIPANLPIITFKALPCLVRICQPENSEAHRAAAADTLAYLTEVDSELQQTAAISNHLVTALSDLLNCSSTAAKQAAFKAFASLGANDEDIRKRVIDTFRLMERVVEGLGDENETVRLSAVRCLHSLSRSVQQLRTTFQDHSVWRPLMALLTGSPPTELLSAASSALCNLLLEFSPAKEPMLQQGVVQILANLTTRPEAALRLNGVWALMNIAFQAEQRVKSQILTSLGTEQIFRLLADSDVQVLMKTLGLLRNLVSPRAHTDTMMALHGPQVMQAVVLVLEGAHQHEVKEQALCILGNIADGERAKDHIMANEDVLKKLTDYMNHSNTALQAAAIFCIGNLVRRGEPGVTERQEKLRTMGVLNILHQLVTTPDPVLFDKVKTALTQFTDL